MRALLLLCALVLLGIAVIPLAGDLAGVRLMASAPPAPGSDATVSLLSNSFVVALFWLIGWLALALLCAGAAVAIDQQQRALKALRQLQREGVRSSEAAKRPAEAPAARRPQQEPRFGPRLAAANSAQPEPRLKASSTAEEPAAQPRGPVLRADR